MKLKLVGRDARLLPSGQAPENVVWPRWRKLTCTPWHVASVSTQRSPKLQQSVCTRSQPCSWPQSPQRLWSSSLRRGRLPSCASLGHPAASHVTQALTKTAARGFGGATCQVEEGCPGPSIGWGLSRLARPMASQSRVLTDMPQTGGGLTNNLLGGGSQVGCGLARARITAGSLIPLLHGGSSGPLLRLPSAPGLYDSCQLWRPPPCACLGAVFVSVSPAHEIPSQNKISPQMS